MADKINFLRAVSTLPSTPDDSTVYLVTGSQKIYKGNIEYGGSSSDTTYTFTGGTNSFTATPSSGTPQTVTITPSIADATTSASGLMSASDKTKLNGIATGAEVNQNAFSNVVVGSTTIAADTKTDSLTLVGSNVTLTPDATNDKVTIGITSSNVTTALGYTPYDATNPSGYTTNTGTVTQVKVGTTAYNPSSGVVSLPAYPTDTNTRKSFFGTCATAAATATKDVTLSDTTGWELSAGTIVGVKFTYSNSASNVQLNVNGTGAKSIYFAKAIYTSTAAQITGWADYIIYYMYDGTNWVYLNNSSNYTNTDTKVTQTATTTDANYEILFSNTADNTTRTEGARKNSNLLFNPSTGNLQTTQLNGVNIGSSPKFTDNSSLIYTIVTTEAELTSALATSGNNILVANSFTLTKTIAITQNNTNLTFAKNVVFDMSGKAFAFITVGTASTKPTYVTINNPKAQGNKISGSIGINLLGMGFGGSITNPTLQSFDVGIKTNSFDCAQLNSLYEPVIQGCNIGIDDSLGGLQAVRVHGGRIESNTNWGIKIGSPNTNFIGTVIEGNGTNLSNGGEVYFTNVSTNRSSAVFVNCYFETLSTTAGNVITANSNWLGNVSLTNCEIYNLSIPVFSYTGSDTKERAINIVGGNVKGTVMVNLPNVGSSTSIFISNVLYDDSTNAIDANINANANKFISGKNVSTTSIVRGKSFMAGSTKDGVVSAENVYSKILQIDTPSGNNNFIRLTQSASNPWADSSVGILKGSLHYNSATNKWYQRITSKGTTDVEANWKAVILSNGASSETVSVVSSWSDGTLPSLTYNATNHSLTFSAGTKPSLNTTSKSVVTGIS